MLRRAFLLPALAGLAASGGLSEAASSTPTELQCDLLREHKTAVDSAQPALTNLQLLSLLPDVVYDRLEKLHGTVPVEQDFHLLCLKHLFTPENIKEVSEIHDEFRSTADERSVFSGKVHSFCSEKVLMEGPAPLVSDELLPHGEKFTRVYFMVMQHTLRGSGKYGPWVGDLSEFLSVDSWDTQRKASDAWKACLRAEYKGNPLTTLAPVLQEYENLLDENAAKEDRLDRIAKYLNGKKKVKAMEALRFLV